MTNQELFAFIKKNPIGVGCAVACLAIGAGIYFRSGDIPAAETELADKTAEADRYSANNASAAQLKEQLEAMVAASKEVDARLVRSKDLGANNGYFYKMIGEAGVKQLDVRPSSIAPLTKKNGEKSPFVAVGFNVAVQGDYRQILHFLALLESGARYCRVLNATCSGSAADRSAPVTLNLNLELLGIP